MSALVLVQEELEELAPAADETAVWVVEAMDVQVASGLSVVGALVEARTLAVHGKKQVSVPENFQEERNFPVAHLETLILVVVLNPTWTGEVKELPFVLETSNVVYDHVEENDCVPGGLQHLPDHHVFADVGSDQSPGGSKAGGGRAAVFGRGRGGVVIASPY